MPYTSYDQPFSSGNFDLITRLKDKDQKIQFRLIGKPYYNGKHFLDNDDGTKSVVDCVRINLKATCDICEKYFTIIKESKLTNDKTLIEEGKKKANPFKAALSFYFPVINRETETFQVFKTTLSVRNHIEEETKLGTPIMERDFVVVRTEKPGPNYYSFSRVDSSETKKLTDKEKEEIEKFKSMDLESIISGKHEEVKEEVKSEEVDVDEVASILGA